uniref:Reverse transcriptase zinc-binding domain-containing protein n=1 Tax=Dicentrarchus labrax TaxID=13489 RepID=A0A8P4GNT1_DICLA
MARSRQLELSQKLQEVDNSYANCPDPLLYKKRLQLQTEFNLLTTHEAESQLLKSRQRFFESGDKAGKLLAQQARTAAASRLIPSIKSPSSGISRQGAIHKLSLYADDLLLYVSNPTTSLPIVLNILKQFGQLSSYKQNFGKSKLFAINNLPGRLPDNIAPFKWVDEGFKYLGVFISRSLSDTFNNNFVPLLKRVEEDFGRWSNLPLSLAGRVNLIKMSVLPKFLYLFQHIPVLISKRFFAKLDKSISTFLWASKPVRMRKKILQLPKRAGGLALPNFLHYYWAANIQKMLFWTVKSTILQPAWVQMEFSSTQMSLQSWLCSRLPVSVANVSTSPVVTQSLKIWLHFRKHFGLQGPSTLAPVFHNHNFKSSTMDSAFQLWSDSGILSIKDLYDKGTYMSFTDLSATFKLPSLHLFCFLQVRHFVQKYYPDFPNLAPQTLLDTLLMINPNQKGNISHISSAMDCITSVFPQQTRESWEQDLGLNIEDDQWGNILELVHNSSICARHGLIQCKFIHRIYYTNHRLSKIYPSVADACNRCHQSPADLMHMFWSCPKLTGFWAKIFDTLQMAYDFVADPHPLSALFGIPSNNTLSAKARHSMAFCTLLARRLILLNWKQAFPPSHDRWIKEVLYNLKLERLRFSLRGSLKSFDRIWNPLLSIIESLDIVPEESDI